MDLYVSAMALTYLLLQIGALFWATPAWRKLGRFPIWAFAAATVVLVAGSVIGSPLAPMLMLVSLPLMTGYLLVLWSLYMFVRPREGAAAA